MTNHATIAHIGPHMKDSKSIANRNRLACAYHMGHMFMTMVFAEQYIQTINQTYTHIYYMHIDMYTYIYIYIRPLHSHSLFTGMQFQLHYKITFVCKRKVIHLPDQTLLRVGGFNLDHSPNSTWHVPASHALCANKKMVWIILDPLYTSTVDESSRQWCKGIAQI